MRSRNQFSVLRGTMILVALISIAEFFVVWITKREQFQLSFKGYTVVCRMHFFEVMPQAVMDTVVVIVPAKKDVAPSPVPQVSLDLALKQSKPDLQYKSADDVIGWILLLKGWKEVVKTKSKIENNPDASDDAKTIASAERQKNQEQIDKIEKFIVWLKENDERAYHVAQELSNAGSISSISKEESIYLRSALAKFKRSK